MEEAQEMAWEKAEQLLRDNVEQYDRYVANCKIAGRKHMNETDWRWARLMLILPNANP